MKILDRLSGQWLDALPPGPALLGRWRLAAGTGDVYLNGIEAADGDCLVPDASNEWRLIRADGESESQGGFADRPLPNDLDIKALLSFGDLLLEGNGATETWLDRCDRSPVAPGLGEIIAEHPLESAIRREIGHLESVCYRPDTHIRLEPERLRVERARRFDPHVYARLASHTEDWARRRLTGVQPSHVLAQVREEQWDLYENRLAARLVDNLESWLRKQLAEVRRILNDVLAQLGQLKVSGDANWHRSHRLYAIWGESSDASAQRTLAEQTCQRLEGLLRRVLGLMDSPLYRAIPDRVQVPRDLRMTNLFGKHVHYRGVARLWEAYSRHAPQASIFPAERYRRFQRLVQGFDAWCGLLVLRALDQLGYKLEDRDIDRPLVPGCNIGLLGGYRLTWQSDGIQLIDGKQPRIRFVPLVHALEHTRPADLTRLRNEFAAAVSDRDEWTVILHPAVPCADTGDVLAGPVDLPSPDIRGAIDWLRVSPLKLDSVERVARLLRWAMLAPRILTYPPPLGTVPAALAGRLPREVVGNPGGGYSLRAPLSESDLQKLDLDGALRRATQERDQLVHEHEDLWRRLRETRGDRRAMADLNARKSALLAPKEQAEANVACIGELKAAVDAAQQALADLSTCPVCRKLGRIEPRGSDSFCASCPDCGAHWELRAQESGELIPVLAIGELNRLPVGGYRPAKIDETLGCDVLAVPDFDDFNKLIWRSPRTCPLGQIAELVVTAPSRL